MEHRTQFSTTVLDVARDAVRIHLACTGCDLMGHVDISPASSADRLIADIAKSHNTPDLFTVSRLDADKAWPTAYVPVVEESPAEMVARITKPQPDATPAQVRP